MTIFPEEKLYPTCKGLIRALDETDTNLEKALLFQEDMYCLAQMHKYKKIYFEYQMKNNIREYHMKS